MVKASYFPTDSRAAAAAIDGRCAPFAMISTITTITTTRGGYG